MINSKNAAFKVNVFDLILKIRSNPTKISAEIIILEMNGASFQEEIPISTNINSNGSTGYSLTNPEKIKKPPRKNRKIQKRILFMSELMCMIGTAYRPMLVYRPRRKAGKRDNIKKAVSIPHVRN